MESNGNLGGAKVADKMTTNTVNRRTVLKGAAAAGAAGVAVGLHPKASKVFAAPAVIQSGPITVKYGTWFWNEPGRGDAWKKQVEKFHAAQTDIVIEGVGVPFDQFTNDIIIQMQAGQIDYDVIQTTPDLVLRLKEAEVLAPLGKVLEANGITTLSSAHENITVDGQPLGLDVVTVVFGLFYNEALFTAAGAALPTNVDEWLAVSTQLTNRPNQFGIYSPHNMAEPESFWFTLQEWALPYGARWAEGQNPLLNTDGIKQAVQLFKNMYDAAFPQGTDDATATRQWGEGQIAQELIVSAAANVFKDTAPELYPNMRTMPLPWESKESIARIHPITVNNGIEQAKQDAAIEWLSFVYQVDNYRELLMDCLDVIPAYDVGDLSEYYATLTWSGGYEGTALVTPPDMVGDFIYNNQELGQIVISNVQNVLIGSATVDDAMEAAQAEAEELAANLFA
jgi:ABC-type glycerol-3-phosphate transport system substrate-binding protein